MFEMQTLILATSSLLFSVVIIDSLNSVTRPVQLSWLCAFWMISSIHLPSFAEGEEKYKEKGFFLLWEVEKPGSAETQEPCEFLLVALLLKQSLLCVQWRKWGWLCEAGYQAHSAEAYVFDSPVVAFPKYWDQTRCTCGQDVKQEWDGMALSREFLLAPLLVVGPENRGCLICCCFF